MEKEIMFHKIPNAVLPINKELYEDKGEISYDGEYHLSNFNGKQILYSITHKDYKENIFVYGYLNKEKHLGEEILSGEILPLGSKSNLGKIIKSIYDDHKDLSFGDVTIDLDGKKVTLEYDVLKIFGECVDILLDIKNTKREV